MALHSCPKSMFVLCSEKPVNFQGKKHEICSFQFQKRASDSAMVKDGAT